MCQICSKLTRDHSVVDFGLPFLLLTRTYFSHFCGASIVDFERVNAGWGSANKQHQ